MNTAATTTSTTGVDALAKQEHTKLLAALRDDDGAINDQLYRLAQVVRLAAFAAEAQRCLGAYNDAVKLYPDCEKHLKCEFRAC